MEKEKTLSRETSSTSLEKPEVRWASKTTNRDDSSTWMIFSENITFHGVRYIFNKTFFILRRLIIKVF